MKNRNASEEGTMSHPTARGTALCLGASWLVIAAASLAAIEGPGWLPPDPPQPARRSAYARLTAAASPSPRGHGALAEYGDSRVRGVIIDLWVDGAVPGNKRVSLVPSRRCRAVSGDAAVESSSAEAGGRVIGTIVIDEQGHGTARLEVLGATLAPSRRGSILGQGLLLHDERDLACGLVARVASSVDRE
jgi:hypothetical protein